MWRRWPVVVSIVVIGLPVAVAIGGVPNSPDTPTLETADTAPAFAPATDLSSADGDVRFGSIAVAPSATTGLSPASVVSSTTDSSPTSVVSPTATTIHVSTTTAVTNVRVPAGSPVDDGFRPRSAVRLFVADGHHSAARTAALAAALSTLGYPATATDVNRSVEATTIYYHPGFEREAVRLAADLGLPGADVRPVPTSSNSSKDDLADIIAVVGAEVVL